MKYPGYAEIPQLFDCKTGQRPCCTVICIKKCTLARMRTPTSSGPVPSGNKYKDHSRWQGTLWVNICTPKLCFMWLRTAAAQKMRNAHLSVRNCFSGSDCQPLKSCGFCIWHGLCINLGDAFWFRRVAVHDSVKETKIETHTDNYDTNTKTG